MRINKIKETYLIGGVAILLLALLSWFFLVSPRMAQASEIGEHQVAVEAMNAKSAEQIAFLTTLKNGLVKERTVAAALAVKFPPTADQPTLFRQIVDAARLAGIPEKSITSLGPAAPILGSPSSGAKLAGAGAAPASEDGNAAAPAQAVPAKTTENMATMAVSFNAEGTFDQMVKMLKNLEDMPRSFLITQVNLSTADKGKFTIAVQGNMYVHRPVVDPDATTYCPPLKLADEYAQEHPTTLSSMKIGELLQPAATAAAASKRTDVSEFLNLLAQANSTEGKEITVEQRKAISTAALKASPTILSECGVNMMRK